MATKFPSNFQDTFTRANGSLGAPWFNIGSPVTISSNAATIAGSSGQAFMNILGVGYAQGTPSDIAVQMTIALAQGDATDQFALYLRMDDSATYGYKARWIHDGTIAIFDNAQGITLAVIVLRAPATGDVFGFQSKGNTLVVFVNGSAVLSVLDNKHQNGPVIGFAINFTGNKIDNFAIVASTSVDVVDTANTHASVNTVNNELICDRTGFRVRVDEGLKQEWTGAMVRRESWESRHPQDFVKSRPEHPKGSPRPQQPDNFITTNVTVNDLG